MSERSFSGAARTNPLYGGGATGAGAAGAGAGAGAAGAGAGVAAGGGRTPSWAKKGSSGGAPRSTAYSEAASSPPDSPGRSAHYYEPQYDDHVYSVQTPGPGYEPHQGSSSPYRQPPSYFVQTPAQSEMHKGQGDHSPFSSAPPSPAHSLGATTTPFDARSTRSGRSRASMRMGNAPPAIKKIDEEEADEEQALRPDPAQAAAKNKRFYKCVTGVLCGIVMLALVGAAVALWFVFQPKAPSYEFQGLTINNFTTAPGYDFNGLPTRLLYMDVVAHWLVKNKNPHFSAYFNGGVAQAGYGSLPVIAQSGYSNHFWMDAGKNENFTSHFLANGYPLYNVGPLYFKDYELGVAQLDITAVLTTYVPVLWKLVQPKFTSTMSCQANFNPVYRLFINGTCTRT